MPQSTKEIKRRIKSVASTKKITKAMELISAVKMRRAVEATLATRFYAKYAWQILINLSKVERLKDYFWWKEKKEGSVGVVVISSDKGLCGNYNASLFRKIISLRKEFKKTDEKLEWIILGKKGGEFISKLGEKIAAVFPLISGNPKITDLESIISLLEKNFVSGKFRKIIVIYTDYQSVLRQVTKIKQLLPISKIDLEILIKELDTENSEKLEDLNFISEKLEFDYLFEPNEEKILEKIIPKLLRMQFFQMFLESNASEQASRMMAMKNAKDAATDMISELTVVFNKSRQAGITKEIAEISAGKAALEDNF